MSVTTLPALSVRQPWAALLVLGMKDIENRTWKLPQKWIGKTVLIHAGLRPDDNPYAWWAQLTRWAQSVDRTDTLRRGGIVGAVEFGEPLRRHPSAWANNDLDTWHWPVHRAQALEFHPCRGSLGIFQVEYPGEVSFAGRDAWQEVWV